MRLLPSHLTLAVETLRILHLPQHRHVNLKCLPLTTEEKFIQVGRSAKEVGIVASGIPHPGTTHEVGYQVIEAPEAEHHAGLQSDFGHDLAGLNLGTVVIQELTRMLPPTYSASMRYPTPRTVRIILVDSPVSILRRNRFT